MMDYAPLILTFKLSLITTGFLLILSIPLAYWLAYTKSGIKPVVETLVSMPLIIAAYGFRLYLWSLLVRQTSFGAWLNETFGLSLLFSFEGLVFASILYSLPFMVQPIQSGFFWLITLVKRSCLCARQIKMEHLINVLLPNMKSSLLTGIVLAFAHTIGEFGLVLMIGGNIWKN